MKFTSLLLFISLFASVPAIDTHDHLWPFEILPGYVETDQGHGLNLASLWRNSYLPGINPLTPWKAGGAIDDWWKLAKHDFDNARATSFYRYQLPAFGGRGCGANIGRPPYNPGDRLRQPRRKEKAWKMASKLLSIANPDSNAELKAYESRVKRWRNRPG